MATFNFFHPESKKNIVCSGYIRRINPNAPTEIHGMISKFLQTWKEYVDTFNMKELLILTKSAEHKERWNDMTSFIHKYAILQSNKGFQLDITERYLLSVAYKNRISPIRASCRTLNGLDDACGKSK